MPNQGMGPDRVSWFRLIADRVPSSFRPAARWLWHNWLERRVMSAVLPPKSLPHCLPGELIVSLTSYPARYASLHLTLRALLAQTLKPDRLILWIAHQDIGLLPPAVLELKQFGLEIRASDDLRSFKKLIPAIEAFPDGYIVTADDDLYYPPNWLKVLVEGVDPCGTTIICTRAIRPTRLPDGSLAPFNEWKWDVNDESARMPSSAIMLESGAGALFPPRSLHPLITNRDMFLRLCPEADDLWINACARMAGTPLIKVGGSFWMISWRASRATSLWESNSAGGNDMVLRALEKEFGTDLFEASGEIARK